MSNRDSDPRATLLRARIRDIPDFPKPGILFRDLTPLMGDGAALRTTIELLAEQSRATAPDRSSAIESRGFIFGAPVAVALGVGFAPVRKPGKLPWRTTKRGRYDLEYGTDSLEMHEDAVVAGDARGDRRRSAGDRAARRRRPPSWCARRAARWSRWRSSSSWSCCAGAIVSPSVPVDALIRY